MNRKDKVSAAKIPAFIYLHTTSSAYLKEFPQSMWVNGGKLTKSKENVYYKALRPVFCVLTVCGVFPFFMHGSDVPRCTQYFVIICSGVVHSTVTVLSIFMVIVDKGTDGSYIQFDLLEILLSVQHFVYLIATWPESSYVGKFLEDWERLQECFENVTGMNVNLKAVQRKIKFTSFLVVLWILINFVVMSIIHPNIGLGIKCLVTYHVLIGLSFLQLWYFSNSAIFNAAAQYEKFFIEKCVITIPSECQVEDFRLLWICMSNIVRQAGNMLAFTMSYFFITSAVLNVYFAFDVLVSMLLDIQDGSFDGDNLWDYLCPFVITGLILYLFYSSAYSATKKCAAVKSYLINMNSTKMAFFNEVQLFMRTLRVLPPVCNLRGFISVDKSSILSGLGVLLTYLIILIQFYINRAVLSIVDL